MSISDRQQIHQKQLQNYNQINKFQWINNDTSLSQFKYHLIVRKIYIPQGGFNQFTKNIYKHFKTPISSDAIHIVQILEAHQHLEYDIIMGFRRDIDAKNIYQKGVKFFIYGKEHNVELAQAFRIYMTQRELPLKKTNYPQNKYKKESRSQSSSSSDHPRRNINKQKNRRKNSSDSNSHSSSKSRSRKSGSKKSGSRSRRSNSNDRNRVIGRYYVMLTPVQWDKQYIEQLILSHLKCKVDDIQIIQKRQDSLTFYILAIYSKEIYYYVNSLLVNFRLNDSSLLLMKQQDIIQNGLKQQLKNYQFKAFKYSNNNYNQKTFEQFMSFIDNFKDFQINILHIFQQENYYIITTQVKINNLLKFVKFPGWKLEQAYLHSKFVVSLKDRWNEYKRRK